MNSKTLTWFTGSGMIAAMLGASSVGAMVIASAFGYWAYKNPN